MLDPDQLSCAVLLTEEWSQRRIQQIRLVPYILTLRMYSSSEEIYFNYLKRGGEKVKTK